VPTPAAAHKEVIPARAVLFEEQDGLSRRADPCRQARGLDLHKPDQAVNLRLVRNKLGEDAPQAQRLLAELRAHPVLAGGRRIALLEDEVEDLEHGG
jgi:hypothetical protein